MDRTADARLAERLAVFTTLILSTVAFKLALASQLPKTASMTYLDWHFAYHHAANGFAFMLSVAEMSFPRRSSTINKASWLISSSLFFFSILHFLVGWFNQPFKIPHGHTTREDGSWARALQRIHSFGFKHIRGFRRLSAQPPASLAQLRV